MEELDYESIEQLIDDGNCDEAQERLDAANARGARWHYLQSKIYLKKNWMNESRKQIEIALELEPENALYIEELERLKELGAEPEKKKEWDLPELDNGASKRACAEMCGYCCLECVCQAACEAICNGCS